MLPLGARSGKTSHASNKVMMEVVTQLHIRHVLHYCESTGKDNALVNNCINVYHIRFFSSAKILLQLRLILLFALVSHIPVPMIVLVCCCQQSCSPYGVCHLFAWYFRPQVLVPWNSHSCTSNSVVQTITSVRKYHLIDSIRSVLRYQYNCTTSLPLITHTLEQNKLFQLEGAHND